MIQVMCEVFKLNNENDVALEPCIRHNIVLAKSFSK